MGDTVTRPVLFFKTLIRIIMAGLLIIAVPIGLSVIISMMLALVSVGIGVVDEVLRFLSTVSLSLADLIRQVNQAFQDGIIVPISRWCGFIETDWFLILMGLFLALTGLLWAIDWVEDRVSKRREVHDAKRESHP